MEACPVQKANQVEIFVAATSVHRMTMVNTEIDFKDLVVQASLKWTRHLFIGGSVNSPEDCENEDGQPRQQLTKAFHSLAKAVRARHKDQQAQAMQTTRTSLQQALRSVAHRHDSSSHSNSPIARIFAQKQDLSASSAADPDAAVTVNCMHAMVAASDTTFCLVLGTLVEIFQNQGAWQKHRGLDWDDETVLSKELAQLAAVRAQATPVLPVGTSPLPCVDQAMMEPAHEYPPVWTLPRMLPDDTFCKFDVLWANGALQVRHTRCPPPWNSKRNKEAAPLATFGIGKLFTGGTTALYAAPYVIRQFVAHWTTLFQACVPETSLRSLCLCPTLCVDGPQYFQASSFCIPTRRNKQGKSQSKRISGFSFMLRWLIALGWLTLTQGVRIPVVGILALPRHDDPDHDYIAVSYAKWCEAAGATTIAIPYNATLDVYRELLPQMDGLLLPGGAAPLSSGVVLLLDEIRHSTDRYFPVWGTCLGFEFLLQYMGATLGTGFHASNVSWPLEQVQRRELYASDSVYAAVTRHSVTLHNHVLGLSPQAFQSDTVLSQYWQVTSINHDAKGKPFVSTIEPLDPQTWPWYGVQYHPEKNMGEYGVYNNQPTAMYEAIDHSATAVSFSFAMAQFWVGKLRLAVAMRKDESSYCRTNCVPPLFTFEVRAGQAFQQIYLIPKGYPSPQYARPSIDNLRHVKAKRKKRR